MPEAEATGTNGQKATEKNMKSTTTYRNPNHLVRQTVCDRSNRPVEVVAGDSAPRYTGESYHYETKGGTRIHHPSAYAKHGWSNMVYRYSTLAIEVGADWLARATAPDYALTIAAYR
jgi:hypothetical protein